MNRVIESLDRKFERLRRLMCGSAMHFRVLNGWFSGCARTVGRSPKNARWLSASLRLAAHQAA